jgi:hypothetical protein
VPGLTAQQSRDSFVWRQGSRLTVAGHEFRFAGGNVEWLGLQNYGYPNPPAHHQVPAPAITSTAAGTVLFQGAAGSPTYSIQKQTRSGWTIACDHCATDTTPGWHDPHTTAPACYRILGYNLDNLDNLAGPASQPAGNCNRRTRYP